MSKWLIAFSVILPTLIEIIDTSVVNVSLGHIRGSLSAGLDESTWAITAYLVSNAIIIPITGWLSRVFGRKRYLMFSLSLFTVSSFLCGASQNLASLVIFRVLQGLGGGALQPISQAILLETFPPAQHGMAMALYGIGVMFGPIVGPVMGGWITDNWSWHWIFYINIPIGILSLLMIWLVIKDPPYLQRAKAKIDYWGLSYIVIGLGCLQIVLDKGQRDDWFSSDFITRLSLISVVALVLFVITELRSSAPIVNLRAFKNISFASGNAIMFCTFFVMFGSIVLLPIYVQQFLGYNAYLAGWALAPGGIATLFAMPLAAQLLSRTNPKYVLVTGLLILAGSTCMMMDLNQYTSMEYVMFSRVVMGFGMGLVFIPLNSLAFASIKKEEMGNATAIFNLVRNLGGSFGVAFVTTLLAQRAQIHQALMSVNLSPFDRNYQVATQHISSMLSAKGIVSQGATEGVLYQELIRQSGIAAYRDSFFFCTLIMGFVLLLVPFLRRVKKQGPGAMMH